MSWTYDPSTFASTSDGTYVGSTVGQRGQVRFLIQDTQSARPFLMDEEIDWVQTKQENVYMMAALCCDILVAKGGMIKSKQIDDFKIVYDVGFYRTLASSLRAQGMNYQIPYAGGISLADKLLQQGDTDWNAPAIARGLGDNPAAGKPSVFTNPLTEI